MKQIIILGNATKLTLGFFGFVLEFPPTRMIRHMPQPPSRPVPPKK